MKILIYVLLNIFLLINVLYGQSDVAVVTNNFNVSFEANPTNTFIINYTNSIYVYATTNFTTVSNIVLLDKLYIGGTNNFIYTDGTNLFFNNKTNGVEQVTNL